MWTALSASASSSCPERITTGTFGAFCMIRRKVSAPWLSGRFRSSSTRQGVSASRLARASESRGTQLTWTSDLLSTRRRRTKSASPGLSSISKTCAGSCSIVFPFVAGSRSRTRILQSIAPPKIIIQISGLADIAIGAQFVTARYIQHRARGTEHHDRDGAQIRVGFGLRQHRSTVFLRQIKIQDQQVGTNRIRILAGAMQIGHGLLAVQYTADLALMPAPGQRLPRKTY